MRWTVSSERTRSHARLTSGTNPGRAFPAATEGTPAAAAMPTILVAWPTDAVGQITALRQLATSAPVSVDDAVAHFPSSPKAIVARHLETLAILGEVRVLGGQRYGAALTSTQGQSGPARAGRGEPSRRVRERRGEP